MASNPIPKKNCTKKKGLKSRRQRELLAFLKAAAVEATVVAEAFKLLLFSDAPLPDETLRCKGGREKGPKSTNKIQFVRISRFLLL